MLDYSQLEAFNRRDFTRSAAAFGLLPFGLGPSRDKCPESPLQPVYEDRFKTLTAILSAQIDSLWCGHQGDSACQVGREFLVYAKHLPAQIQKGLSVALLWLDVYSIKHTGQRLHRLGPSRLRRLLNQGEQGRRPSDPPQILWSDDHLFHMAVSGIAMLGRLVIYSRTPARQLIGLGWSTQCGDPQHLVHVPAPPQANLSVHYDAVVIGSGAGGSVVADRLASAGRRVLILDAGDYVSPDALIQREVQEDGSTRLAPPRSDEVLYKLYKHAGGQVAGGLGNVDSKLDLVLPWRRKNLRARQTITIAQAEVFGGGPYVNNAIHLPISEATYAKWGDRQPTGVGYAELQARMDEIGDALGVNTHVTETQVSDRSMRFAEGCRAIGEDVKPLPVSIRPDGLGCGSDNSVDGFGDHVGGVHPYRPDGKNSFLVNAMHRSTPAEVSCRTRATKLRMTRDAAGQLRVQHLEAVRSDAAGCHRVHIRADQYVVAAGTGATSKLIGDSLRRSGLRNRHVGKRLTANVGTAMYAMFDKPIWPSNSGREEPGVTQCFLVDRRYLEQDGKVVEEPTLENWFHFPGTVALALTGWFKDSAQVMRRFNHLSMAGLVVPTAVRPRNYVDACGKFHLELTCDEFELMLRGMRRIARIYFAAAKPDDGVTLFLPTKALLTRGGCPLRIREMEDFEWALRLIRRRGPAFINLLTAHPQGGASIGDVVDPDSFRVKTDCGDVVDNLFVGDASLHPQGCEINPQLTIKAMAGLAAERMLEHAPVPTHE